MTWTAKAGTIRSMHAHGPSRAILIATLFVACNEASDGDAVWFNRTEGAPASGGVWQDVASDASGASLVAVTSSGGYELIGDIWTSSDYGATWINRTATQAPGQRWKAVASDASGTHLVALTLATAAGANPSTDVWTSVDAGVTWVKRTTIASTSPVYVGPTVASDATGTHLVVAAGNIWTSADMGMTWTDRSAGTSSAAQRWVDLASDATGARVVAVTAYGDIWTSSDHGATWTNRTAGSAASTQDWSAIASDATGTHLVAVCTQSSSDRGLRDGDIWTSTDAGATWINQTARSPALHHIWTGVASDASGTHLIAVSAHGATNDIWTSHDAGVTWVNETTRTSASGQQWNAVASDANGVHLVAVSTNPPGGGPCCAGDIWTN